MIVMFKEYIDDGVYVEFIADTGQIRLYTERMEGTHEIFFEGPEINAFNSWYERLKIQLKEG